MVVAELFVLEEFQQHDRRTHQDGDFLVFNDADGLINIPFVHHEEGASVSKIDQGL